MMRLDKWTHELFCMFENMIGGVRTTSSVKLLVAKSVVLFAKHSLLDALRCFGDLLLRRLSSIEIRTIALWRPTSPSIFRTVQVGGLHHIANMNQQVITFEINKNLPVRCPACCEKLYRKKTLRDASASYPSASLRIGYMPTRNCPVPLHS